MQHASTSPSARPAGDTAPCAGSLVLFDDIAEPASLPRRRRPSQRQATVPAERAPTVLPAARDPRIRERPWPGAAARSQAAAGGEAAASGESVIKERCQSLLRINDWEGLRGTLAVNPYRGSDAIGGAGGLSMSRSVYAKENAAQQLRDELRQPRYQVKPIQLGTAADAYQEAERSLRITRGIVALLHDCGNPAIIVTRSTGVLRDIDLLLPMARRSQLLLAISLCTLDRDLSRHCEPDAHEPAERLAVMKRLIRAGVPVGLHLGPGTPRGDEVAATEVIEAAAKAGATWLLRAAPPQREAAGRDGDDACADDPARTVTPAARQAWIDEMARRLGVSASRPALDCGQFRPPALLQPVDSVSPQGPSPHGEPRHPQRCLF